MTNEELIWYYLSTKIKNEYGVAGLMGNLFAESSLNPINATGAKKMGLTNREYTDVADEHKNDNFVTDGVAYGLAQWCFHTRKKGLLDKAKAEERSVGDINLQLEYLWQEIQLYKTVIEVLQNAKSVKEASDIVLTKYERPAGMSDAVKEKRAKFGQKYYDKYANGNTVHVKLKTSVAEKIVKELEKVLK